MGIIENNLKQVNKEIASLCKSELTDEENDLINKFDLSDTKLFRVVLKKIKKSQTSGEDLAFV